MNHTIISNDCPSGELTCVDEKLVGDSRMINVMDSSCKNGGQDFQICEDGLQSKMSTFHSMSHLPILLIQVHIQVSHFILVGRRTVY